MQNEGKHIENIINSTVCGRHQAERGVACWSVATRIVEPDFSERFGLAVCGKRIHKAGFNGRIDPRSLRSKSAGGRSGKVS